MVARIHESILADQGGNEISLNPLCNIVLFFLINSNMRRVTFEIHSKIGTKRKITLQVNGTSMIG